jgi:prepilin-type N-terminal cleavage/methylation domain-containing protein
MFRRLSEGRMQARPGLTLLELLVALVVLGLLGGVIICRRTPTPGPPTSFLSTSESVAISEAPGAVQEELSLQETLDRLGFTVNVPQAYRGHSLARSGYRMSTADDTVDVSWFRSSGSVTMQLVSQQTDLDSATRFFVLAPDSAADVAGFAPLESAGFNEIPQLLSWDTPGPVRLGLEFHQDSTHPHPVYSTPEENPSGNAQLMVLPARRNGLWVEDHDGQTGFWEGGEDTGEYLLCWEDQTGRLDGDFQDLVLLARGIVAAIAPVIDRDTKPGSCGMSPTCPRQ